MPKEIKKLVYTFKEMLDLEKQKKMSRDTVDKARAWLQETQTGYKWWEYVYEDWVTALEDVGLLAVEISFSGFWSQGDGASFTAEIDLPPLIEFLSNPPFGSDAPVVTKASPETYDWRPWLVKQVDGVQRNPEFNKLLRVVDSLNMSVVRAYSQYSHERSCGLKTDFYDRDKRLTPKLRRLWEDFCNSVEQFRLDACRAIYRSLNKEYEYLTDDKQLIEISEDSQYTFDNHGDRDG